MTLNNRLWIISLTSERQFFHDLGIACNNCLIKICYFDENYIPVLVHPNFSTFAFTEQIFNPI